MTIYKWITKEMVMATRKPARTTRKKPPLAGQVAIVAGGTRGAGRGIARALGEAGAVVYCTGRSVTGRPSPYNRPETIDETAEMINAAGGEAIAVRVDHTVEDEVKGLIDRIERERGRLDVLADSVAGEDPVLGGWTTLDKTDLSNADRALKQSLVSHVITAKHASRLMKKTRPMRGRDARGLIVEVTEFDLFLGGGGNIIVALVKTSLKTLALLLAEELRKDRIAALAITPGYRRSESMLQHFGVTEANWRDGGKKDPHFLASESPLFIGRAVAALARDPKVLERSGQITSSWELAREFGFTDENGERPDAGKHWVESVIPSMKWLRDGIERQVAWLDALSARGKAYLS
jgi:NAD(P)-dependent dehydrogenase (short-subunit alcohol dehydrogenase family)